MKSFSKGFIPLQMTDCLKIDFGNASRKVTKKKHFLSVTGFTLLELMISVAILLIVISGLFVTFVYCILMNESNNNLVKAANHAQYVMEQIKGVTSYDGINSYSPPVLNNNLPNENIPNPTITDLYDNQVKEVTVNVNWVERGRQRNFQLSTRIAKTQQ